MLSKYSYCLDEFNETEFLFKEYYNAFNKEFNIVQVPRPEPVHEHVQEPVHERVQEHVQEQVNEHVHEHVHEYLHKQVHEHVHKHASINHVFPLSH